MLPFLLVIRKYRLTLARLNKFKLFEKMGYEWLPLAIKVYYCVSWYFFMEERINENSVAEAATRLEHQAGVLSARRTLILS